VEFHDQWTTTELGEDPLGGLAVVHTKCAGCKKITVAIVRGSFQRIGVGFTQEKTRTIVLPRSASREPLDSAVPVEFSKDYIEACDVLDVSPKASAALSRRCLQHILRECAKVKKANLDNEIQQVLDSRAVPSHIADSLDAIRTVGNFAAHPIKSTSSGEVVDVEPGEAEWNLDTVEALFDFYFTQPAKTAARRDALNRKLTDAGKPPLK
jgi:hypothetical protein